MKLKTQFRISLSLVGAMLFIIVVVALLTNREIAKDRQKESLANGIAQNVFELKYLAEDYLMFRGKPQLDQWESRFALLAAQAARLHPESPEQLEIIQNIEMNRQRLKEVFDSLSSPEASSSSTAGKSLDPLFLQATWSRIVAQSNALASDASRLVAASRTHADSSKRAGLIHIFSVIGIFGIYFFTAHYSIINRTLKAVALLQAGAEIIGSGNLDFKLAEEENNEIGDLSRAFNRMTRDLQSVTASKSVLEKEIAERNQIERQLKEAAEKYSTLFNTTSDGVWINNLTGEILEVNDAYCRMSGYSRDELLHMPISSLEACESPRDIAEQRIKKLLDSGGHDRFESRHRRKDGSVFDVDITALLFDRNKGRMAVFVRDITVRKQAQEELARSKRRIAEILESIQDGFFTLDRSWRLTYVNERAASNLGLTPEYLIEKDIWEEFPQLIGTGHEVNFHWAMTNRGIRRFEMKGVLTDKWYSINVYPSEEGISVYWQDITSRKQVEDRLRESEECLQSALSGAEAGLWIWDLEKEIQTTNQINVLFGRPADGPLATQEEFYSLIHPDDLVRVKNSWDMTVQTSLPYDQEFRIIWPDGTIHWLASRGKLVTLPSGARKLLGISFGITERKFIEEELQKSKFELEDKVRKRTAQLSKSNESLVAEIEERKHTENKLRLAQKNLRAMASEIILADEKSRRQFATELHDSVVQTLGAAKLRSQFLREYISDEGIANYVQLQDLLSRSINEARQIMSEMSPPVLNQLGFMPAMEWLSEQFGSQNGLTIRFRANNDSGPLSHEVQVLLFQATRELLMNVVKHSQCTEAVLLINQKKGRIRITVKDRGVGFHGKVAFREDNSGFGLFSIRERLRHLGGQLIIESRPGRGTRVTMVSPTSIEQ